MGRNNFIHLTGGSVLSVCFFVHRVVLRLLSTAFDCFFDVSCVAAVLLMHLRCASACVRCAAV